MTLHILKDCNACPNGETGFKVEIFRAFIVVPIKVGNFNYFYNFLQYQ